MLKVKISWYKLREIAQKSIENYEYIKALDPELRTVEDVLKDNGYVDFEKFINDPSDLPDFMFEAATWEAVRPLKLLPDKHPALKEVKELLHVAQVHLPGNELMRIRHVIVREDCCTDELQKLLNEGWHMVAVCPQMSRRPDYILGRNTAWSTD